MRRYIGNLLRAPVPLVVIFIGLLFIGFGFDASVRTIRLGIVKGLETNDWKKADRVEIFGGSISSPGTAFAGYDRTDCELLNQSYFYEVDGVWHESVNYHSMGMLIADPGRVYDASGESRTLDAWYDPNNPSDAVLKRGVSYDCSTFIALRRFGWGCGAILLALTYVQMKPRLVKFFLWWAVATATPETEDQSSDR